MDMHLTDESDEAHPETPEDVAILYSWANLHGARYRDFSASRREYRAQVRHRAAEDTRQAELAAQVEAERAAAEAERIAQEAEAAARAPVRFESSQDRDKAVRTAEDAGRRAAAERLEAARRAEAAALAEAAARREEREIAEAHASAQRQAAKWHESEVRRRSLAGPQPTPVPSLEGDPYEAPQGSTVDATLPTQNRALEFTQPQLYDQPRRLRNEVPVSGGRRAASQPKSELRHAMGYKPDQPSGMMTAHRQPSSESRLRPRLPAEAPDAWSALLPPAATAPRPSGMGARPDTLPAGSPVVNDQRSASPVHEPLAPAWLTGQARPSGSSATAVPRTASAAHSVTDTLQQSREKVASRWFALKGVFDSETAALSSPGQRSPEERTPVLSVFSLAGGVGKTTLVATLGRALSSLGEKVLLADATSHGLLPYYFGATELKPGVVRTFSPPSGSSDAQIHLAGYEADQRRMDKATQDGLADRILDDAKKVERVLIDFNTLSGWLIRKLPPSVVTILVPVAPDMNSVISLQAVEKSLQGATGMDGRTVWPHYVLNQFDASLPLHLDVREVLRRQLGERLLPFVIRRSHAVSEALAEGMTVMDYQQGNGIAEDFLSLAKWLQGVASPATRGFRTTRWSER